MNDNCGVPLAIGDRVIPMHWGDIPLWLCGTPATITGFGRTRVQVRFDQCAYREGDKPHTIHPGSLRKLEGPSDATPA